MDATSDSTSTTLLLQELASTLMSHGNYTLDGVVREFWCEFCEAVMAVGRPLGDERSAERVVAALFASRVHLQVGSSTDSLRYALAAVDVSGAAECSAYAERIIVQCIDHYNQTGAVRRGDFSPDLAATLNGMFRKCLDDNRCELAVGLALKTRRMDLFVKSLDRLSDNVNDMLLYALRVATNNLDDRSFRITVLRGLVSFYQNQKVIDYVCLSRCFMFLDNPKSVAQILGNLVKNDDDKSRLMAYQIAFDLFELANQHYLSCVLKFLRQSVPSTWTSLETHYSLNDKYTAATSTDVSAYDSVGVKSVISSHVSRQPENNKRHQEIMLKLTKVLVGDVSIEQNLLFLTRNNHADMFILKNTKKVVHTNICHTATMIANGFMHSGTTCDQFLRYSISLPFCDCIIK